MVGEVLHRLVGLIRRRIHRSAHRRPSIRPWAPSRIATDTVRNQSGHTRSHDRTSPLISPETLFTELDRPDLRSSTSAGCSVRRARAGRPMTPGTSPGAIFLDLDADLAAPSGPGRHPLPDPRVFRERLEAAGIGAEDEVVAYDDTGGNRGAPLVDARRPRPRACRGARWRDQGLAGGRLPGHRPTRRPRDRRAISLARRLDEHDRPRCGRGEPRVDGPARCPRAATLSRRSRTDRPHPRAHPDRTERSGRGNLGPDGRLLDRPPWLPCTTTWAPIGPTSRWSPRAAAASPPASPVSRCASPACPNRSSTPAPTPTGPSPASTSPPAPNPASRPDNCGLSVACDDCRRGNA